MKLFEIDQETRLPVATAEARTIKSFNEILKRLRKSDGDSDGRKKKRNEQELAYVYFQKCYDSRFKLLNKEEREVVIKKLIGLPDDWQPDELIKQAIEDYAVTQETPSLKLVEGIELSIVSLSQYVRTAQAQMPTAGLEGSRAVSEFLDILDRVQKTVETLRRAKDLLVREQEDGAKGRKGRTMNKFEE